MTKPTNSPTPWLLDHRAALMDRLGHAVRACELRARAAAARYLTEQRDLMLEVKRG